MQHTHTHTEKKTAKYSFSFVNNNSLKNEPSACVDVRPLHVAADVLKTVVRKHLLICLYFPKGTSVRKNMNSEGVVEKKGVVEKNQPRSVNWGIITFSHKVCRDQIEVRMQRPQLQLNSKQKELKNDGVRFANRQSLFIAKVFLVTLLHKRISKAAWSDIAKKYNSNLFDNGGQKFNCRCRQLITRTQNIHHCLDS